MGVHIKGGMDSYSGEGGVKECGSSVLFSNIIYFWDILTDSYDRVRRVSGLRRERAVSVEDLTHICVSIPLKRRLRPSREKSLRLINTSNCSQPAQISQEKVGVYFSVGYIDMREVLNGDCGFLYAIPRRSVPRHMYTLSLAYCHSLIQDTDGGQGLNTGTQDIM